MIVGLLASQRTSGGGIAFRRHLITALAAHRGVDRVVVIGDAADADVHDGDVVETGSSNLGPLATSVHEAVTLPHLVRRHDIDVLICPGNRVPARVPAPCVFWPLTVAPVDEHGEGMFTGPRGRVKRRLMRRVLATSCRRADAIVFSSRYARDLYDDLVDLDDKPSAVIHPAGTVPVASSAPAAVGPWDDRPFVLMVSHLYPYKLIAEAIDGFTDFVGRTGAPHALVIAGNATDAAYAAEVERRIAASGLSDRIWLLGGRPPAELADLYRSASTFVFSSACENAGSYAVIDALAYGLPVICSRLSSTPEIVGDAALMYDPRSPAELARCLQRLLDEPDLSHDLRRRAWERAAALPTWDRIADDLVMFLRRLTHEDDRSVRAPG